MNKPNKLNLVKNVPSLDKSIVFAIDFDGTCVTHEFPRVGRSIGAEAVLRDLIDSGHLLVLNTMRSGQTLQDAVDWFKENNLPLYGVNHNPDQDRWTSSPKVYAQVYLDDAALGCPLKQPGKEVPGERPHVDWVKVRQSLIQSGFLEYT